MTTMPDEASARRRAARRRHLHERQAVIFGTLITALLAAGLLGLGVWFGAIPAPFDVPFATPTPEDGAGGQPCPPEGALPVSYEQITLNVYNGTTRPGLAAEAATELGARGLVIATRDNDPFGRYEGATLLRAGYAGLPHAYTVAAIFPDAVVQLDARGDASVDVTLGSEYEEMRAPQDSILDPAAPLVAPEGCYVVEPPAAA